MRSDGEQLGGPRLFFVLLALLCYVYYVYHVYHVYFLFEGGGARLVHRHVHGCGGLLRCFRQAGGARPAESLLWRLKFTPRAEGRSAHS